MGRYTRGGRKPRLHDEVLRSRGIGCASFADPRYQANPTLMRGPALYHHPQQHQQQQWQPPQCQLQQWQHQHPQPQQQQQPLLLWWPALAEARSVGGEGCGSNGGGGWMRGGGGGLCRSADHQHHGAVGTSYPHQQHSMRQSTQPHTIPANGAINTTASCWVPQGGGGEGGATQGGVQHADHAHNNGSTTNTACDLSPQHSTEHGTGSLAGVELPTVLPSSDGAATSNAECSAGMATTAAAVATSSQTKEKGARARESDANNGGGLREVDRLAGKKETSLPAKRQKELCPESSKVRPHLTWQATRIGAGLDNLGNTCYMNAILQCLSYLPPVAEHFLRARYVKVARTLTQEGPGFGNDGILVAMQNHVQQVHQGGRGTDDRQAIKPTAFFDNLSKIGGKFRQGRQEDAHEFLRHLVDKMVGDCLRRRGVEATTAPKTLVETTPIHGFFAGSLRSQLKCTKCGHCSDTFDPFMDLSMNLESATSDDAVAVTRRVKSVPEALKRFTSTETLGSGNEWRCGGCERLVEAEKRLTVSKPPKALVIQLKRFVFADATAAKIKDHVLFGSKLKIEVSELESPVAYDLTGVVVHAGESLSRGHFYAYVLSSTGCWAKMDDDIVTKVDLKTVLADNAYILFYTRRPIPLPLVASVSRVRSSSSSCSSGVGAGTSWTGGGCEVASKVAPVSTVTDQAGGAHPTTAAASGVRNGNGDGAPAPTPAPAPAQSKNNRKRARNTEGAAVARSAAAGGTTPASCASETTAEPAAVASSSRTKPRVTVEPSGGDGIATSGDEGVEARSRSAGVAEVPATPTTATDAAPTRPPAGKRPPSSRLDVIRSGSGVGGQEAGERPAGEDKAPERGGAVPAASPSSSPPCVLVVEPVSLDAPDAAAGKLSEKNEVQGDEGEGVMAPCT